MTAVEARRVLIVEDNPDSRAILKMLLEVWGHEVEAAEDGREGVAKALAWRPEVAVVDIGLPYLDGHQVAAQVRSALGKDVRLIALTAYAQPEDRRRALDAGFDFFLAKPADPDELGRLVAGE
jgi:CheY-like chemotaxis protein